MTATERDWTVTTIKVACPKCRASVMVEQQSGGALLRLARHDDARDPVPEHGYICLHSETEMVLVDGPRLRDLADTLEYLHSLEYMKPFLLLPTKSGGNK